jgi:hypothetical protein
MEEIWKKRIVKILLSATVGVLAFLINPKGSRNFRGGNFLFKHPVFIFTLKLFGLISSSLKLVRVSVSCWLDYIIIFTLKLFGLISSSLKFVRVSVS